MKPTKMRNNMIYKASHKTKTKHMAGMLSKDLRSKYGKRSARIVIGDSIIVTRGEFKGVNGKISNILAAQSMIAIDGVKKEKSKGDKFDVLIHASNIVITSLHEDKWRLAKLEGKNTKTMQVEEEKEEPVPEQTEEKEAEPDVPNKDSKEEKKEET